MRLSGTKQLGFTLVEMIIALGLSSLVVYAVIRLYNSFEQSSRMHALMENINDEQNLMVNTIEKSWSTRYHNRNGMGQLKQLDASYKAFSLRNSLGQPCASNCPKVDIEVDRSTAPGGKDVVTVETKCINPGAITDQAALNSLNFSDPSFGTSCAQCANGTIPIVWIRSQNFPTESRRFPTNGSTSPASFRINSILGMSACWDQTGVDPAFITLRAYYRRKADDHSGKLEMQKSKRTLPFDNLSKLNLRR